MRGCLKFTEKVTVQVHADMSTHSQSTVQHIQTAVRMREYDPFSLRFDKERRHSTEKVPVSHLPHVCARKIYTSDTLMRSRLTTSLPATETTSAAAY